MPEFRLELTMSTPDRLAGVRAKIKRATKHIQDLESSIQQILAACGGAYGIRTETDPETGDEIQKIDVRSPIPDDFVLTTGDAVHNLRSALDHLACRLVLAGGGEVTSQTYFPICKTAPKYEAESKGKIKGMSPAAVSYIDGLQPYQGGNDDLWTLHELDIIDKHKLLIVAAYGPSSVMIAAPTTPAGQHVAEVIGPIGLQPNKRLALLPDGTVVGRIPKGKTDVNFYIAPEIAFREPEIVEGKAVVPFLHQLAGLVSGIANACEPWS
jgi:hypothetical protein